MNIIRDSIQIYGVHIYMYISIRPGKYSLYLFKRIISYLEIVLTFTENTFIIIFEYVYCIVEIENNNNKTNKQKPR